MVHSLHGADLITECEVRYEREAAVPSIERT
nr:MAG TPA: hypothetical protein [Caudoviricetes sp.]